MKRLLQGRTLALLMVALGVWIGGIFVCAFNERPLFPPALRYLLITLEQTLYDRRMEMRPGREMDPRVVVITIDGDSEEKLGAWPWSRRLHAELIRRLTGDGALAIGFDVGFAGERKDDPGADRELARAVRDSGKVIVALYPKRDPNGSIAEGMQSLPAALDQAVGEDSKGMVVLLSDEDKGFRAAPLKPGRLYPSLDARMLERMTGQPGLFYLPVMRGPAEFSVGPFSAPVWRTPNLLFIDFPGKPPRQFSYADVVAPKPLPAGTFTGKLVLVGSTLDLNDAYRVPRNNEGRPSARPDFPGVLAHACILDNILRGQAIRHVEYPLEPPSSDPWIGGASVGGLLLLLCLALHHRLRLAQALLGTAALLAIYMVVNFGLFVTRGLYLNLTLPALMLGTFSLGVLLLDTRRVRHLLGRFVPDAHVEELLHSPERLEAANTTQEATVLFVDIRDYTTLSEKLGDPAQVRAMVGRFHRDLAQVFERFGGYVCDFQGDAQMVAFGVSPKHAEHFRQALQAARALPLQIHKLNCDLAQEYPGLTPEGEPIFRYGVGICTGPVSVGYLQGGGKLQHTVLGDTTNTAARLQNIARDLGVIAVVSHTTADRLGEDEPDLRALEPVLLKGKAEPHRIFELIL